MGLQNRVSPDGSLHVSKARGLFIGNRGVIHDPDTKTLKGRRWSTPAWICCSLEWKGRRRKVWGRNYLGKNGQKAAGWSELFFCDEVTALAAGHRPCHTCRNSDAKRFYSTYCAANGQLDASGKNKLLHKERWHSSKTRPDEQSSKLLAIFPDGAMIKSGDGFFAIRNDHVLKWGFEGYGEHTALSEFPHSTFQLVTPPSIIGALKHGYAPVWHPTAS